MSKGNAETTRRSLARKHARSGSVRAFAAHAFGVAVRGLKEFLPARRREPE
jgi:hypothetical protein